MHEQVYWQERRDSGRRFKTMLFLGIITFSATLAMVLGEKIDQTAAGIITGVAVGVAAGVPTTFILLVLLRNRQERTSHERPIAYAARQPYTQQAPPGYLPQTGVMPAPRGNGVMVPQPPVIVVAPPGSYDPRAQYPNPMPVLTPAPREFQVIGEPGYYADEGY
jgi:hypothetical protein